MTFQDIQPPNSISKVQGGLLVRSLEDVQDVIDPRISTSSRPDAEELDEGLGRQLSRYVHESYHHRGPPPSSADTEKATVVEPEPFYVSTPVKPFETHKLMSCVLRYRSNSRMAIDGTRLTSLR